MDLLHQIFYGNNKFDITEESIADLNKWAEFIQVHKQASEPISNKVNPVNDTIICEKVVSPNINTPAHTKSITTTPIGITPLSKPMVRHSSLFWCVFLAQYGYSEYLRVGTRFQNRELEEKQCIMESLSKNAKQMKDGNMKLTNDAVQEILSGLMVSAKDELSALVAYSKYYKKTIYLVFEYSYLIFSFTKDHVAQDISDICVIYQTRKHPKYGGSYSLEFDLTLEKLQSIRKTKLVMEHYEKPFRGISVYKMTELNEMATKIGILDAMKKQDLYTKIVEKCCEGLQR